MPPNPEWSGVAPMMTVVVIIVAALAAATLLGWLLTRRPAASGKSIPSRTATPPATSQRWGCPAAGQPSCISAPLVRAV